MNLSIRRIQWLRAQLLINKTEEELRELSRLVLKCSRLGFILRSSLTVVKAGKEYESLMEEAHNRLKQLDYRLDCLHNYSRDRFKDK